MTKWFDIGGSYCPYLLNKIVGGLLNPFAIGIGLVLCSVLLVACSNGGTRRGTLRCGMAAGVAAVLWFWSWGTQVMMDLFALPLETEFPVTRVETVPTADAIVVLGGGMGANTNVYPYAEMWSGADRVWHAARLFRAGKAPLVVPTGQGEEASTVPLLRDLGVPPDAIRVESAARNTEENARFIRDLIGARTPTEASDARLSRGRPRILLVTSAWHMRRSVLMFRRYAPDLDIVPAPADYEALVNSSPFRISDLLPSYDRFLRNCVAFKEHVGYWGYRLFR